MSMPNLPLPLPKLTGPIWPDESYGDAFFKQQLLLLKDKYDKIEQQITEDECYAVYVNFPATVTGEPVSKPKLLSIPPNLNELYPGQLFEWLTNHLQRQGYAKRKELIQDTNLELIELKQKFLHRNTSVAKPMYFEKIDNQYFFKGQELIINQGTDYRKVFDIIFDYQSSGAELVSYEYIEKKLVNEYRYPSLAGKARNTRIQNALNEHQGLLKYARLRNGEHLPSKLPNDKTIFEIIPSKGVIFNNLK